MNKEQIRKEVLEARKALTDEYKKQASEIIFEKVNSIVPEYNRIFVYVNMEDEVQTGEFMKSYEDYAVPKCFEDGHMEAITGFTMMMETPFGTMEPYDGMDMSDYVDAVIIPGVAFSKDMDRIGYGKGYYDKYLAKYPKALKVGICFDMQLRDDIEPEEHDVKMDYIVTEKQILRRQRCES